MVDDSNNSVTAGARGEFTMISAQRPAPHLTHPPRTESRSRFQALAGAALSCVLALAVLATPALAQAPAAVSDVVVVPVPRSSNSLTVSWSAPDNAGKPAITGYDVQYRETDTFNWTTVRQNDAPSTSVIIGWPRPEHLITTSRCVPSTPMVPAPGPRPPRASRSPPSELVHANHPLIPDGLGVGDSFRLLFVTARYEGRHWHGHP